VYLCIETQVLRHIELTGTLNPTSRDLAMELHRLLRDLDPARYKADLQAAAQGRLDRIRQMMEQLRAMSPPERVFAGLRERMAELAVYLDEHSPQMNLSAIEGKAAWMRFRTQMQPRYEVLAKSLREFEIHVPSLRPTNYKRNVFHLANAGMAVALILIMSQTALLWTVSSVFVWAWCTEGARRVWPKVNTVIMAAFAPFAHPHEAWRINSATWYTTALLLLALTGDPLLQLMAVVVLGVADPMAAIIGRRFGRTKLLNGRSLEGSTAFFISGTLGGVAVLMLFGHFTIGAAVAVASCAALPAAMAELLSRRVDDNFTIPLTAAAGAWAGLQLLGLFA
jgi:dolichol kinase